MGSLGAAYISWINPELAYLDSNVWAVGQLETPRLIITRNQQALADETIEYAIADADGNIVSDTATVKYSASETTKIIPLGDFIDAQYRLKGLTPGFYFIVVKNVTRNYVWVFPIMLASGSFTPPSIDPDKLQYYTVFDKALGVYLNVPKTVNFLPSDPRFDNYAYFKDGANGRLVKFDSAGNVVLDTGYHQLVYLKLELPFSSPQDMLLHMLTHSYGLVPNVVNQVLTAIQNGDFTTALNVLRPFYMYTWLGRVVNYDFVMDVNNNVYKIVVESAVFLGEWDWGKIIVFGAIGCGLATATVLVASALTAGLASVSLPIVASACLAGGGVGALIAVATGASTSQPRSLVNYYNTVDQKAQEGKQKNNESYTSVKDILDTWLKQGKITQDDYNQMLTALQNWKTAMDQAIDELGSTAKKLIDQAYKDGYNDGYNQATRDKWLWVAGAGVVGLVAGVAIGRR